MLLCTLSVSVDPLESKKVKGIYKQNRELRQQRCVPSEVIPHVSVQLEVEKASAAGCRRTTGLLSRLLCEA